MNADRFALAASLFLSACNLPESERGAFLDRECGGDLELRREVEALLAGGARSPVTAHLAGDLAAQVARALAGGAPGDVIGPYTLVSKLGEGGFGDVWLAERSKPFAQRVALKIVKPGMDSRTVVARFEQERQTLAVMEHPHIARVIDGGVTDAGRPYFVMEYVKGEPITAFAATHRLSVRQRLELFLPVCEAVQHAHRKGIIHRDLKPSNVLVEVVDGQPMPKVIDFGIAKAVDHAGRAQTLMTEKGLLVGTPEYMSPEQAEGLSDIDTRTDVYSLGVVLYELLVGAPPFDGGELRSKGYEEILRVIREVEPPRPSTRAIAVIDQAATGLTRETSRELAKELEWIPLKALRKDRERRYSSPESLAADIRRYLAGDALEAGPESRIYRAKKFVRRNKVQVSAVGAVALALVAGFGTTLWQAREAAAQARRADERAIAAEKAEKAEKERADQLKKVSDFQSAMLSQIDTTKAGIDLMTDVRERFVAALEKTGVPEADRTARVDSLRQELVRVNATDTAAAMIDRTILKPAIKAIDEQFKDDPETASSLRQALADLYETNGLYESALPLQEVALATRRRVLGDEHPETLQSINNMGFLLYSLGEFDRAEVLYHEAIEKRRRVLGEEHPDTIGSINNMGLLFRVQGRLDQAAPYYREALEKSRRVLGEDHPDTLQSINNTGVLFDLQGDTELAEQYYREALEKYRRVLGEDHPDTIGCVNNIGAMLWDLGRLSEAKVYWEQTLEKRRRVLGDEHPDTLQSINNMGALFRAEGELDKAESFYREALVKRRRVLGDEHPETLQSTNNMGVLLELQGKADQAESHYREAFTKRRRVLGEQHPETLLSVISMGSLLQSQGRNMDAIEVLSPFVSGARAAFEGNNVRRLAAMLATLGRARMELGHDSERFTLAEANLVEANALLVIAIGRGPTHKDTLACVRALIDLYTAWDTAEPGKGYDAKAAEWKAKLPASTDQMSEPSPSKGP
jgi:eukaryotic-like serine/threonine-protein kinase